MAETRNTTWQGFLALALESERMRVVMVPDLGGKIVSLFDRTCGHEWLVPPMRPVKQTAYGAEFVAQDMSGWDEMMPTINACDYNGAQLPDHGEVWSIPWRVEGKGDEIVLSVEGTALPYRFTRSAAFVEHGSVEFRYTLENLGQSAFPYLWAAHPQFAAGPGTRILFPPEVQQVVNVIGADPVWGAEGSLISWPEATSAAGKHWSLDRVGPVENHACRKFYIQPDQPVSWAALFEDGLGCGLRLEWSAAETPYLGLWIDEGTHNAVPVAALEPATGYYDSLVLAVKNGRVPVIQPGEKKRWSLRLRFFEEK